MKSIQVTFYYNYVNVNKLSQNIYNLLSHLKIHYRKNLEVIKISNYGIYIFFTLNESIR
jgi:hypothetical protein